MSSVNQSFSVLRNVDYNQTSEYACVSIHNYPANHHKKCFSNQIKKHIIFFPKAISSNESNKITLFIVNCVFQCMLIASPVWGQRGWQHGWEWCDTFLKVGTRVKG